MKNKAVPLSLLITVLLLLRFPLLAGFVPAPEPNELPALLVAGAVASFVVYRIRSKKKS
jgi:hypothetical protein